MTSVFTIAIPGARHFFPIAASAYAARVDHLALFLFGLSAFFTVAIAATILVLVVVYRRKPGVRQRPPGKLATVVCEAIWIGVPLAIVVFIYLWGANLYVEAAEIPADAEEVTVVAKQWMWKLQHENGAREINELHMALGTNVKLVMISQDVIHSFYVPELRVKMDVLPDRYTFLWLSPNRPGVYHLYCAQFCGTQHARMRGRVIVQEPEDYARWLETQGRTRTLAAQGAEVFEKSGCPSCHRSSDANRAPILEGVYGSRVLLADGTTVTADADYLRESIVAPAAKIVAGYSPIMPAYGQSLSDEDVLALVAYLESMGAGSRPLPRKGILDERP